MLRQIIVDDRPRSSRRVLGFTYSDAAAVLGVPHGTVMSRLSRARTALKRHMENLSGSAPTQLKIVGGHHVAK